MPEKRKNRQPRYLLRVWLASVIIVAIIVVLFTARSNATTTYTQPPMPVDPIVLTMMAQAQMPPDADPLLLTTTQMVREATGTAITVRTQAAATQQAAQSGR